MSSTNSELYTQMSKRCATSAQTIAKAIKVTFESDEVKSSVFLAMLPDTMDHVIDDLSSRDIERHHRKQFTLRSAGAKAN